MSNATTVVPGGLTFQGNLDAQCFTSWSDFLRWMQANSLLNIPGTVTNVVVSPTQPSSSQTGVVWVKQNSAGQVIGIFFFSSGNWVQVSPSPNEVIRMYGNSTQIPDGYELISNSTAGFTAAMVTHIQAGWLLSVDTTHYVIFDVIFVG